MCRLTYLHYEETAYNTAVWEFQALLHELLSLGIALGRSHYTVSTDIKYRK